MVRWLGLDLSTKPGIALAEHSTVGQLPVLIDRKSYQVKVEGTFPFDAIDAAEKVADIVQEWYERHSPDKVIIEQSNKGRSRYTQKKLEFIHSAVLRRLRLKGAYILYIDTSEWRRLLEQKLSKEDRKNNAAVSKAKKTDDFHAAKKAAGVKGRITGKHLAVNWCNAFYDLGLKMKDNDVADAICLIAAAVLPTASFCDGT
jgi:hypothetical protein